MTNRIAERQKKGLVLSGGGKRGVFQLAHLDETKHQYTHINGVSTGILAGAMFAAGKTSQAIDVYTEMANAKIYSHSPLTRKGTFSIPNIIFRLLRGKTSLGELHRLEELIRDNFTLQDFGRVQDSGIDVRVYAHCIQRKDFPLHSWSTQDGYTDYKTFVKAMVASCCFYPLGHVADVYYPGLGKTYQYVDGGHADSITINQMLRQGIQDITVYILQERIPYGAFPDVKNLVDGVGRVARGMRQYQYWNKLHEACELAAHGTHADQLTIRAIYLPQELSNNAMDFNAAHAQQYERMGRDLELVGRHTHVY